MSFFLLEDCFPKILSYVGGFDLCNLFFVCKTIDRSTIQELIAKEILSSIRKNAVVDRTLFERYDNYNAYDEGTHEFGISSEYDEHCLIHLIFSCAKRNDVGMLAYILQDPDVKLSEKINRMEANAYASVMCDVIDDESYKYITLLQYTAHVDSYRVASFLLEHGIEDVNSYGVWGMRPVIFACMNLSVRTLRVIIDHMRKTNAYGSTGTLEEATMNTYGWQSYCPYKMGIRAVHALFLGKGQLPENHSLVCDCLDILLDAQVDVNSRTGPLDLSADELNVETCDPRERFAGFTALHLATITKNLPAVIKLVDAGAKQYRLEKENVFSCVDITCADTVDPCLDDFDDQYIYQSDQDSSSDESTELVDEEDDDEIQEVPHTQGQEEKEEQEEEEQEEEQEHEEREEVPAVSVYEDVSPNHILILCEEPYKIEENVPMRRLAFPVYLATAAASIDDDQVWMEIATYLHEHAPMVLTLPQQSQWYDLSEAERPEKSITVHKLISLHVTDDAIEPSDDTPTDEIVTWFMQGRDEVGTSNDIVWSDLLCDDSVFPDGVTTENLQAYMEDIIATSPRFDLRGFICTRNIEDACIGIPEMFVWEILALMGRTPALREMFLPELSEYDIMAASMYVRVKDRSFASFIAANLHSLLNAFIDGDNYEITHDLLEFVVGVKSLPLIREYITEEEATKTVSSLTNTIDNEDVEDENRPNVCLLRNIVLDWQFPGIDGKSFPSDIGTQLGHAYLAMGQWEDALATFADYPCEWGEAEAHAALGHFEEAKTLFANALATVE